MPVTCLVVGCGSRANRDNVSFYSVPAVRNNKFLKHLNELSERCRAKWIAAIKREDLTESKLKNQRICSKHFITGKPAALEDENHPDWYPTQNMGHSAEIVNKRNIKFRILKGPIPISMLRKDNTESFNTLDKVVVVCSALINISPPIIPL